MSRYSVFVIKEEILCGFLSSWDACALEGRKDDQRLALAMGTRVLCSVVADACQFVWRWFRRQMVQTTSCLGEDRSSKFSLSILNSSAISRQRCCVSTGWILLRIKMADISNCGRPRARPFLPILFLSAVTGAIICSFSYQYPSNLVVSQWGPIFSNMLIFYLKNVLHFGDDVLFTSLCAEQYLQMTFSWQDYQPENEKCFHALLFQTLIFVVFRGVSTPAGSKPKGCVCKLVLGRNNRLLLSRSKKCCLGLLVRHPGQILRHLKNSIHFLRQVWKSLNWDSLFSNHRKRVWRQPFYLRWGYKLCEEFFLQVRPGHEVFQISTGTNWNLCWLWLNQMLFKEKIFRKICSILYLTCLCVVESLAFCRLRLKKRCVIFMPPMRHLWASTPFFSFVLPGSKGFWGCFFFDRAITSGPVATFRLGWGVCVTFTRNFQSRIQ